LRNDVRSKKETLQKLIENYENGILPRINFVQIISYHNKPMLYNIPESIVVYLTSKLGFFGTSGPVLNASETSVLRPTSAKKAQLTHERVEYNVFLFDKPLKGSKSLKIFKISLTFRFDKW
jgi:hypothetical protein